MDKLSKYEKETTITYSNGDPNAEIYTYDKKLINSMKKKGIKVDINEDGSVFTVIPKSWLKISTPRKVSEETRLARAAKAKLMGKRNGTIKA